MPTLFTSSSTFSLNKISGFSSALIRSPNLSTFFDCGSDRGSATRAAEILNKNGSGYGYGLGLRIQSPLGPIRIDYGISDGGDSRINFGIGERF